jgi:glucose 1-dehydrogenase
VRALTVVPGRAGSAAVTEVSDPEPGPAELLVDALALGICGTDAEIVAGEFGSPPVGEERLVLGHESLGVVREAPEETGFAAGDLVVAMVREPDPVPCVCCAAGEVDMCRNGLYVDRGIKDGHGYGSERWTVPAAYAVRLDAELARVGMLLEPTTIVAKAWEHLDRIGARLVFEPRRLLVTGAGPIGLLTALFGARRGLEVHVLDRVQHGPKPDLVAGLGAEYHSGSLEEALRDGEPDLVVEATGSVELVFEAIARTAPGGIVCLLGVSPGGHALTLDAGLLNTDLVLSNTVVFGSVSANRRHYEAAAGALAEAERSWLERLITRRVPLEQFEAAFERRADDVKVVIELGEGDAAPDLR